MTWHQHAIATSPAGQQSTAQEGVLVICDDCRSADEWFSRAAVDRRRCGRHPEAALPPRVEPRQRHPARRVPSVHEHAQGGGVMAVVIPNPNPPLPVVGHAHLCPSCRRVTWGEDPCSLCRKGARTRD